MSNHPEKLKYVKTHEYINQIDTDHVLIGITDFAQSELGDITFVELPKISQVLSVDKKFGVVESVKSVSDLFMPVSGEIVDTNSNLENKPELVNNDCYGEGWLVKVKLTNKDELSKLMTADDYKEFIVE